MISRKTTLYSLLMLLGLSGYTQLAAAADSEAIGKAITGEFALQSGDLAEASRDYLAAAQASADPDLAEHATRVALIADDLASAQAALARWQQLAPGKPVQDSVALHIALRQGQLPPALAVARRMLAQPQGWQEIIAPFADTPADKGVSARALIHELLDQNLLPEEINAWLAFAGLARRLSDTSLAHDIEAQLLMRFPGDPRAQLLVVARLRENGDRTGARAGLDKLLAADSLSPEVRKFAAAELDALGDPKAAAQAIAQGPQDDLSYAQRAVWLDAADDQAGLAALYAEMKAAPDSPMRKLLLGQLAEVLSLWPEAEQWYRGIQQSPQRERAQLRLPVVLEKLGRLDAAVAMLRQLQHADADGNDSDRESRRDAYLQEAELWARRKNDPQAMAAYRRGLAVFADDALLLYGRGLHLQTQGHIDAALADLKKIIDRDGDNAEALNAYGYTLAESRQRYADALPFIEKANRLKPDSAATLDSLGWVKLKLGEDKAALPLLEQAWQLQKDAEIAAHLGEALWLAGDKIAARKIWQAGLALDAKSQPLLAIIRKYSQ